MPRTEIDGEVVPDARNRPRAAEAAGGLPAEVCARAGCAERALKGKRVCKKMDLLLAWCASELGRVEPSTACSKSHPGQPVLTHRLRLGTDDCYLKSHRDAGCWEAEVHGYEEWATAFGNHAPRLLGVREEEPRALVVSALGGRPLEEIEPAPAQERAVWRDAGRAVARLHDLAAGDFFGPWHRDGSPRGDVRADATDFVSTELQQTRDRGRRMGYLSGAEQHVVHAAMDKVPAFEGEAPVPCHRDYCPANWIVGEDGTWAGVVDFELSRWDVRATDFTRYPDWDWITRPDLVSAFFEGYGKLTPRQEEQRLVALVRYALTAVVWGEDNEYHGFAEEGRKALMYLASLFR